MTLGVDYHPEQWPEQRWAEDARLMREAGIRVVRLGEFAWSSIEPDDNYYNLRWLNRIMDLLLKQEIKVVLALPIASPPPWLVQKFPEILPMDSDGRRVQPGLYNHRCFLNKHYHDYARNFTMRLTKEIWGHRAIIGWQIGNKLGGHRCFCETCHRAFLEWLRKKHKDIESLNADWGAATWGQGYVEFNQIPLPWQKSSLGTNPALELDFRRFHHDVILEFFREQTIIVQRYTTKQFITLNVDGLADGVDLFELAKPLHFASCEQFPVVANAPVNASLALDVVRGLKQSAFWVMEQQAGARDTALPPGAARMYAWRSIGHGADGVVLSQWRTNLAGRVQLSEGVLGEDGVPRRRYQEIKTFGEELAKIAKSLEGSQPRNPVAVLWDTENHWATRVTSAMRRWINPVGIATAHHEALRALGLGCDVVGWQSDFTGRKLLLLPPQPMLNADRVKKLEAFVAGGGQLIVSAPVGTHNMRNVRISEPPPGGLRGLMGVEVIESVVDANAVQLDAGGEFPTGFRCDVLELKGAAALARYTRDFFKGSPAATVHTHGAGKAYYVGAVLGADFYGAFLLPLVEELGLRVWRGLPASVEVVSRSKEGKEFLFITNQGAEPQTVNFCRRGQNLLTGTEVDGAVTLDGFGVAVIEMS